MFFRKIISFVSPWLFTACCVLLRTSSPLILYTLSGALASGDSHATPLRELLNPSPDYSSIHLIEGICPSQSSICPYGHKNNSKFNAEGAVNPSLAGKLCTIDRDFVNGRSLNIG